MTTYAARAAQLKSPTSGGLRGPTYRQPHTLTPTTHGKIPHSRRDFASPYPAPSEEEEEELKCKNKPTFPYSYPTDTSTH